MLECDVFKHERKQGDSFYYLQNLLFLHPLEHFPSVYNKTTINYINVGKQKRKQSVLGLPNY